MEYIFTNEKGEKIKADLERWGWGVVYKDGSELHQFSEDGTFHQFGEIKQDEVSMFTMYRTDEMNKRIDVVCRYDVDKYFHFYRNMILNATQEDERKVRVYVFGWKNTFGSCSYNYILPDDRLITADHDIVDLLVFNI